MSELHRLATAAALISLLLGCDGGSEPDSVPLTLAPRPTTVATESAPVEPSTTPTRPPPAEPVRFRTAAAMATIRHLAVEIGPREATSIAYRRAAGDVQGRFEALGYDVRRQHLRVPAGISWGVPVDAGLTWNVIAEPPGFDPTQSYRIVGAHLDTVPQAPGAEDDASGIAVMLELARLAAAESPTTPVVFVAFAAEEPRGDGDALHHFGSRAYVAAMTPSGRRAVRAMVAMDRVGVGRVVPVCTGAVGEPTVRGSLLRVAERVGVPATACINTSSDHWSFQLAGMPAARVGGTSYAAYHSAKDLPGVVSPGQLRRVGRLMWAYIRMVP